MPAHIATRLADSKQMSGKAGRRSRCSLVMVLLAAVVVASSLRARTFVARAPTLVQTRGRPTQQAAEIASGVAPLILGSQAALAADAADAGGPPFLAIGVVAVVAGAAALLLGAGGEGDVNDKEVVKNYFNNEGFNRWNKIYGETEDINPVQKDIRVGHAQTVDRILSWLDKEVDGKEVCDAGCGTGNLTIPLAERGALVSASDISAAMVAEAERRAEVALENAPGKKGMPNFVASDLEKLDGEYDCVCCVDVLIHYPPEKLDGMVGHLASLSRDRVILSFAPKTWYYLLLKRIGELFPGPAKTTRAYLHEEDVVEAALKRAGYEVKRKSLTATTFYFSRIFEARPIAAR